MSQPAGAPAPRPASARGALATAPPPTAPPATAPAAAAAYRGGPPAKGRARTWVRGQVAGTPGRMRLLAAAAALVSLLFGGIGASTLLSSSGAIGQAAANTEQIVRVQSIYADMLRADADATNAFLVGGNEDPTQRADYEAAMKRVAAAIAVAAREQRADGTALAALNAEVQTYAALVEQARAYNRQGLPVGAQYQTQASDQLRTKAVPVIQALLQANTDRARGEFGSASRMLPLVLVGLLVLVVLLGGALWLALRTHRYVNTGLTAAVVAILAAFVAGLVVLGSIGDDVRRVSDNQFAGTLALTSLRSAAYDAKANESLGLIARGQAEARREPAWKANAAQVSAGLGELRSVRWYGGAGDSVALGSLWGAYVKAHDEVRAKDNGTAAASADWDGAVALATDPTKGTRPAFAAFEKAASSAVEGFQGSLVADIAAPSGKAVLTGWLLLLAGLAGAVLATRGITRRVEEYR